MAASIQIRPWREGDDASTDALEGRLASGLAVRTARRGFRARAARFSEVQALVAELDGQVVGLLAVGFKTVVVHDRARQAALYFDLVVDPAHRRKGVARALIAAAEALTRDRVSLRYSYVVDDPTAERAMAEPFGSAPVGGYRELVAPSGLDLPIGATVRPCTFEQAHESCLQARGKPDFYSDPAQGSPLSGQLSSWLADEDDDVAGCSAWDGGTESVQVVQSVAAPLAALSWLAHRRPLAPLHLPVAPTPGQQISHWVIFDLHATSASVGRSLFRHVLREAKEAGVHACHFLLADGDPLLDVFGAELPPSLGRFLGSTGHRFALHAIDEAGPINPVRRLHVDVRDV